MSEKSPVYGLSASVRDALAQRLSLRRPEPAVAAPRQYAATALGDPAMRKEMATLRQVASLLKMPDPYCRVHDGVPARSVRIGERHYDSFTSYNYLGLNGDPRVSAAAKSAIDDQGTSVSASRIVSGERALHRQLEADLAALHGTEDCMCLVSGHATNVSVIGTLIGPKDACLHDALSHNSIIQGAIMSGARRISFKHNDLDDLDRHLADIRGDVDRVLIIVEGHYSMDGDVPELARLRQIADRWGASLMVDEAHSVGVLGATGAGIAEHCGLDGTYADLWMGTLSKTLAGCGGYVAGRRELIDYLRFATPGYVYSVGLPPPLTAAAIEALRIMRAEPERVVALQRNGRAFLQAAQAAGLDTGTSIGAAIVPVIVGSSIHAAKAADLLFEEGINVHPIIYPAVPERTARLRFFITADHDPARLADVAFAVARALDKTRGAARGLDILARKMMD